MASELASQPGGPGTNSQSEPFPPTDTPNTSSNLPVSHARLEEIVTEACDNTLQFADSYQHPLVGKWNTNIIQSALAHLIKESNSHKFIVTSTIIQHTTPPAPLAPKPANNASAQDDLASGAEGLGLENKAEEEHKVGRRGLHSATGAYWNNERDGTWSWQWKGSEKKGFDVIATVFWIATV
ncbi:MAG: hypothetical protein HETSPECPRED_004370 [Heterodermia speciosa]|uniref:Dynein light chain n=1 Tax=Heterodermia speciosa TaxID=116794 RepID=A0A8H3FC15_9LECA|nr:MAG: hypothetical protein HETSPECPRED_004370 [Heterodermia speciosa]